MASAFVFRTDHSMYSVRATGRCPRVDASRRRYPAVAKQPAEPTAVAREAGGALAMLDRSGAIACRTINRIGGSHRHQRRQLREHGPCVSKNGELRIRKGDNLQIEWFL